MLSAKAEYACLAMLELAAQSGADRPVRLADVASKHGIPQRFLVQILLQLKVAGLVESTRGASGGYHLARDPAEVSLLDILDVIDRADPPAVRPDASPLAATLQGVWERLHADRRRVLRATTLAELVELGQGLQYVI